MLLQAIILTIVVTPATAQPSSSGPMVATCYRRMNITLSQCMKSPGKFDMHLYDRSTKSWTTHNGLNCCGVHGGQRAPGPEPYGVLSLSDCESACSSEPQCTGIVTSMFGPAPPPDLCKDAPTQCSEEICNLKPGQVQRLQPGTYYHNKQIFLPKGSAIIGAGINTTYVIGCGLPTASGCNMTQRRGFLMGDDTYVGNFTFRGREDRRGACPLGAGMIETPGCLGDYCGAPNAPVDKPCNPPDRSMAQCTGVSNATAEYIHLHSWTQQHVAWLPPTVPWGENETSGSTMVTLRNLTSWGSWADGINFHGGHKYGLVEDCEISYTSDDLYAHWPQATFRPGFEHKHDPRDCSDQIIFRNNIGRFPRFGTNPTTICGTDCSSHTNPCFSLWGSGSNMAILDNHCEEADGPVAMHPMYTNFHPDGNIQMWCGPIAVDGNSYANPGYCASQHCQANNNSRVCFTAGSWPTDGTIGEDPGCNNSALPSDFRERLWKGLPSVAFPKGPRGLLGGGGD